MLGTIGGLAGRRVGIVLAHAINAVGIPMPAPPGSAHGYIGGILLTPRLVAESLRARRGDEHGRKHLSGVQGVADADRRRLAAQPMTCAADRRRASMQVIRLALRNLARQRMRTGVTLAAIAFGVAALIVTGGFVEDIFIQLGEALIHSQSGHLQVAERGYFEGGTRTPERFQIRDPDRAARPNRGNARSRGCVRCGWGSRASSTTAAATSRSSATAPSRTRRRVWAHRCECSPAMRSPPTTPGESWSARESRRR